MHGGEPDPALLRSVWRLAWELTQRLLTHAVFAPVQFVLSAAGSVLTTDQLGVSLDTATGLSLATLATVALWCIIGATVYALSLLVGLVQQRNIALEVIRTLQAPDEVEAAIDKLETTEVRVERHDVTLVQAFVALEMELGRGWRVGTWSDLRELTDNLLFTASWQDAQRDPTEPASDGPASDSARDIAARLSLVGVVEIQALPGGRGARFPEAPPSDIVTLTPLGRKVMQRLKRESAPTGS